MQISLGISFASVSDSCTVHCRVALHGIRIFGSLPRYPIASTSSLYHKGVPINGRKNMRHTMKQDQQNATKEEQLTHCCPSDSVKLVESNSIGTGSPHTHPPASVPERETSRGSLLGRQATQGMTGKQNGSLTRLMSQINEVLYKRSICEYYSLFEREKNSQRG